MKTYERILHILAGIALGYFMFSTPVNSTSMGDGVDLSVLGEMDGVVDYYIDNSKLYIYTVEDSINDEMDRIKFINSLDPGLGE